MPSYSVKQTNHLGGDVLEVLCDQKEWGETHPHDEHFRFGPFKARMIVAAKSVISDFLESEGQKPPQGVTVIAHDDPTDPAFSPSCSTYDHFFVKRRRVDQPYLKLRVSRFSIGLGLSKAEAIIVLMEKVEAFAHGHRV